MLLIIKFIANLFKILNSEISPRQIAAGFAWGVAIGLLPVAGLLPYVLLILGFIININLAAMFFAAALFKILSFGVDPLANQLGYQVLVKIPSLKPFWTNLFNMPIVPYTRFNNTLVMGSLVLGLALIIPMYFMAQAGVKLYRTRLQAKVAQLRIVQVIKASSFFKYYQSYQSWKGQ